MRSTEILKSIENFQYHKYSEARKHLNIGADYDHFADDIQHQRNTIKSLLTGLICTYSSNLPEIDKYKKEWVNYGEIHELKTSRNYHHYLIYLELCKVKQK